MNKSCLSSLPIVIFFLVICAITGLGYLKYTDQRVQDLLPVFGKIDEKTVTTNYMRNHPEYVAEFMQDVQAKKEQELAQKMQEDVGSKRPEIENAGNSPVAGNISGDVIITLFSDNNCGYCKRANRVVKEFLAEDKGVKVIFKEYPILGETSTQLAKMALAISFTDKSKYIIFHDEITELGKPTDEAIGAILQKMNLDKNAIKAKMESDEVSKELADVARLAESLDLHGTPVFIIGGELIPGLLAKSELQDVVNKVRAKGRK
jgi:protein-disulfide isomerase